MHVPVRRVDVPRPGHGVDRDPALPEPGDDPLLLARDPADRPALQQDGYVHATPRGIDERLGEHGARELVGRDEDLPAGAAGEGEEDLLGTVRGDEGDAVHTTERRLPELRLAEHQDTCVPRAVLQVMDLALARTDHSRPFHLLDRAPLPVEGYLVPGVRELEPPGPDHVGHFGRGPVPLVVRVLAVAPPVCLSVPCDHAPARKGRACRETHAPLSIADHDPVEGAGSLEAEILVAVIREVRVRAELGEEDPVDGRCEGQRQEKEAPMHDLWMGRRETINLLHSPTLLEGRHR